MFWRSLLCFLRALGLIMSPLCTQRGETYIFYFSPSFLCHISFLSVRSILSVYHAGGQTRNVDPMSGYCWPNFSKRATLTQLLFKASWGYYSQHEVGLLTTVEWILASTGDAGPTFTRHWVGVGLHCLTRSPANTRRWTSAGFMLGQHHRRWARIGPSIGSMSRVCWEC